MGQMKNIILIVLVLFCCPAWAQKIPAFGTDKIRISADDKIIQAELEPVKSEPTAVTNRLYYWYSSNNIHATQGSFSGRLLNGKYVELFLNKNLKEEGFFVKGLKDGAWKSWDETGILKDMTTWKKGVKDGDFLTFDNKGKVKQQGRYSENMLDGKSITIDESGKQTAVKYKAGRVVIDSPSKFWKKVTPKIFRRKAKASANPPVNTQGTP
jgi:hypothetical protein